MTTYGVDRTGGSTGSATVPAIDSIVWNDVVFLTSADSPYTIVDGDRGKLFAVDCSGGAVTINLPSIAALTNFPDHTWLVGIKKTEASGNAVTINRNGTDTIDSDTSKTLVSNGAGLTLVPDADPSPDRWVTMEWGPSGGNLTIDSFSGDGSDTTFELSVNPGSENNTFVFISGVYQQKSEYSVSGTTLTFSEAPPSGTNNIQVVIGTTLTLGVPSDGTVATAKLADRAVTAVKLGAVPFVSGVARNLAARTHASTPASQITITADELVVKDTDGYAYLLSSVNVSPAITSSGANGLDAGAEAGNTWYYGWVIYNPTTQTVAGLLSTSSTAPTMPSGYTAKVLVSAVRNDGSSNFLPYRQKGNRVFYVNNRQVLSSGSLAVETAVSTAVYVPPIALSVYGFLRVFFRTTDGAITVQFRLVAGNDYMAYVLSGDEASGASNAYTDCLWFEAPNESQNFYYLIGTTGTVSQQAMNIDLVGFSLPLV